VASNDLEHKLETEESGMSDLSQDYANDFRKQLVTESEISGKDLIGLNVRKLFWTLFSANVCFSTCKSD
jgi:hypothetical protein